jgi:hypothetical protein
MGQRGSRVTNDYGVEPHEAVALWKTDFWDTDRFVAWMRERAGIGEERAREIVRFMTAKRGR